jgi:predicted GH43/DUF377 family glycosyl hydrolase
MSSVSAQFKEFEKTEEILKENPHRWVMFPVQYPKVWEMYKRHATDCSALLTALIWVSTSMQYLSSSIILEMPRT